MDIKAGDVIKQKDDSKYKTVMRIAKIIDSVNGEEEINNVMLQILDCNEHVNLLWIEQDEVEEVYRKVEI